MYPTLQPGVKLTSRIRFCAPSAQETHPTGNGGDEDWWRLCLSQQFVLETSGNLLVHVRFSWLQSQTPFPAPSSPFTVSSLGPCHKGWGEIQHLPIASLNKAASKDPTLFFWCSLSRWCLKEVLYQSDTGDCSPLYGKGRLVTDNSRSTVVGSISIEKRVSKKSPNQPTKENSKGGFVVKKVTLGVSKNILSEHCWVGCVAADSHPLLSSRQ